MFLIKNGINRNRMSFKGFGTSKPIYPIPEKSAQEEEDNRRVEIMILSK
jgi:flagellar motor protein MotB